MHGIILNGDQYSQQLSTQQSTNGQLRMRTNAITIDRINCVMIMCNALMEKAGMDVAMRKIDDGNELSLRGRAVF